MMCNILHNSFNLNWYNLLFPGSSRSDRRARCGGPPRRPRRTRGLGTYGSRGPQGAQGRAGPRWQARPRRPPRSRRPRRTSRTFFWRCKYYYFSIPKISFLNYQHANRARQKNCFIIKNRLSPSLISGEG